MDSFRFGVVMHAAGGHAEWAEKCREAEALGYDVILVPDHLGIPSPFPALTAAAVATERIRVGTFVVNTVFANPTLLARDAATVDRLTGGRLELGLGAGHRKEEFTATGIGWRPLGERIEQLAHTLGELTRLFGDEDTQPRPVQAGGPPVLIGGNSDQVLRLAAERAATVGLTPLVRTKSAPGFRIMGAEEVDERVAFLRSSAAGREVELNVLVRDVVVTPDREAVARQWLAQAPYFDLDQFYASPTVLLGTVDEIAEQVRAWRKRFGITYLAVHEPRMAAFAPVAAALRGE
jgi:probable F420-dependent oxidoreductase